MGSNPTFSAKFAQCVSKTPQRVNSAINTIAGSKNNGATSHCKLCKDATVDASTESKGCGKQSTNLESKLVRGTGLVLKAMGSGPILD